MNSTCELGGYAARALKPYPAYKDSGVEWLGKVPAHWEVLKLRHVLRRHTERERPDLPLLSVVREQGVILRDTTSTDENHNYIPDDLSNYKVVRAGQFAMNKMKAWQGSYGVSCHDGIVSPAYFVFDVLGLEVDFFHAAIRSRAYVPAFTRASDGVRIGQWDLAEARMREVQFLVPPAAEQAAIVRFLDHADRRIRRYIRAKQQLIALLEEQKQAIIHQAVTRGLDPNVRLKPSGVEWLGDVPEHWERRAVWQLFEIGRGKVTSHEYIANHSGSFPLYSSQTANDGVMGHIDTFMFDGDFLTWTTDGAHAGTVFRRSGKFNCTNVCGTLFPKTQFDLDFMRMAIASETKRQVRLDINPKLMNNMMARIRVSVPPYDEQVRITKCVQGIAKPSDSVIEQAQLQVGFLREYRTRLIADVVTGKFDVREAAARLPDEVEELEPLDEADALIDGEEEPTDALATAP